MQYAMFFAIPCLTIAVALLWKRFTVWRVRDAMLTQRVRKAMTIMGMTDMDRDEAVAFIYMLCSHDFFDLLAYQWESSGLKGKELSDLIRNSVKEVKP